MKLTMLYKDENFCSTLGCPSVHLAENGDLVVQVNVLDPVTDGQLDNILPGEAAVRISAEVVSGFMAALNTRIPPLT